MQCNNTHLIVFRGELIQTFLDDVVAVQIFDEHHNVQAEGNDDRVDLVAIRMISTLVSKVSAGDELPLSPRTWRRVERKSIIF